MARGCWLVLTDTAWGWRCRGLFLRRPAQDAVARGDRGGGAGGTSLAATTSDRAITTSERRVSTVHSPSDSPTSSPSSSVRPPSMRYLTTTRIPRGAFERKCRGHRLWGTHSFMLDAVCRITLPLKCNFVRFVSWPQVEHCCGRQTYMRPRCFSQTEFASVSFYPNFVWFLSRDLWTNNRN